jgi:hypothetical protein
MNRKGRFCPNTVVTPHLERLKPLSTGLVVIPEYLSRWKLKAALKLHLNLFLNRIDARDKLNLSVGSRLEWQIVYPHKPAPMSQLA